MIRDSRLLFGDSLDINGASGYIGDSIDVTNPRDISGGEGQNLYVVVDVTTNGTGSGTIQLELHAGTAVSSGNLSAGQVTVSVVVPAQAGTAYDNGDRYVMPIPQNVYPGDRHLRYWQIYRRKTGTAGAATARAYINFGAPKLGDDYADASN